MFWEGPPEWRESACAASAQAGQIARAGPTGAETCDSSSAGCEDVAGIDPFDRSQETIAAAGESLDESRTAGRVAKGLADAIDRGVDAVLEVDEGAFWP